MKLEINKPKQTTQSSEPTKRGSNYETIKNTDDLIEIIIKSIDPFHEVNPRILDLRKKLLTDGGYNNRNNTYHVKGIRLVLDYLTKQGWVRIPKKR